MVEHWVVLLPQETIGLKVSGVGLGDALQHLDLKLPNAGTHSLKQTYLKIDGWLLEDYLPFGGKGPFSGSMRVILTTFIQMICFINLPTISRRKVVTPPSACRDALLVTASQCKEKASFHRWGPAQEK